MIGCHLCNKFSSEISSVAVEIAYRLCRSSWKNSSIELMTLGAQSLVSGSTQGFNIPTWDLTDGDLHNHLQLPAALALFYL